MDRAIHLFNNWARGKIEQSPFAKKDIYSTKRTKANKATYQQSTISSFLYGLIPRKHWKVPTRLLLTTDDCYGNGNGKTRARRYYWSKEDK